VGRRSDLDGQRQHLRFQSSLGRPDLPERLDGQRQHRRGNRLDVWRQHDRHVERRLAYHAARRLEHQHQLLHDALKKRDLAAEERREVPLAPLRISQIGYFVRARRPSQQTRPGRGALAIPERAINLQPPFFFDDPEDRTNVG
jgi:hypothetical protein